MAEVCDALILSDFHLGSRKKARPKVLRKFLDELAEGTRWNPHRVILNGDVIESLDFRKWPISHLETFRAIRQLAKVRKVAWVIGNHEDDSFAVETLMDANIMVEPPGAEVRSGGKLFLAMHGHCRPKGDNSGVTWTEAVTKLGDQWSYKSGDLREAVAVARGAVEYARKEGFVGVICGDTHAPFCGTLGGFPYANCGSWTKGQASYVVVHRGQLHLHHY
jgi:UDP-2,3-diacylglucosamine pyrophosphatase LpxH